jgi:hypothetical protein
MMFAIFVEIVMILSHVLGFRCSAGGVSGVRCQVSGIQELRDSEIRELEKEDLVYAFNS